MKWACGLNWGHMGSSLGTPWIYPADERHSACLPAPSAFASTLVEAITIFPTHIVDLRLGYQRRARSSAMTQGSAVSAETGNGWIASVPPEHATGPLAQAYQSQFDKLGRVTELTQLGSLYPDLVATRLRMYAVVNDTPSGIPDWARRAVALVTSVLNGCLFCTAGHTQGLRDDGRGDLADAIVADPATAATGDDAVDALLAYTRLLVRRPGEVTADDIASLRAQGWSDMDILDVNNLSAYYCYI